MSDSRAKVSAPQQRLLFAADVIAWTALLFGCTAMLMLAFNSLDPGHWARAEFWAFALVFDLLPFVIGLVWLLIRAAKRLADEGTDVNNWSENFPSRIWPVLLPISLLMWSVFVTFVMILIKQVGK